MPKRVQRVEYRPGFFLPVRSARKTRPRLLDLFCGAGGCSVGYERAGFEVVGVDINPQPRYPFEFRQDNALELLSTYPWWDVAPFDAIHASPPCQAHTSLNGMWNAKEHVDLVAPTRKLLEATGLPYVIENVPGAPLIDPVTICGSSLGLAVPEEDAELRRHRLFESNWTLMAPPCAHGRFSRVIGVYGGHGRDRRRKVNTQDFSTDARRKAMGIDWMTGTELSQAIPPAYTELIGHQLMQHVRREALVA